MSRTLLLGKILPANARRYRVTAGPVAAAVAATLIGSAAFADVLEEITVTAQKRSENIQEVPIAITAFTADELQSRNLVDIHALSNLTSGVNLDAGAPFSGDRSVLSASIRGIGQDDFAFNLNPGVGVYLDGVYLARTIGSNLKLLDVDRIEILKGPQGTLFGANTIGGAISVVTHTPGDSERFIATATGGQYNRLDVGFTADIPIIANTLLSTISVSSQKQTGWVKVIPYPASSPYGQTSFVVDPQTAYPKAGYTTADNYGGTNVQSVRGKLLWKASDKLTVTFAADWTYEDQTALPYTVLGTYSGNLNTSDVLDALQPLHQQQCGIDPRGHRRSRRAATVRTADQFLFCEHVQPAPGARSGDVDRRRAVARRRLRRRTSGPVQCGERCGRAAVPRLELAAAVVGLRAR